VSEGNQNYSNLKGEECTCYKCSNTYSKRDTDIFRIHQRNHTSYFASIDAEVCLCKECQDLINTDWFDNDEMLFAGDLTYNCEEELQEFINSFPLEYQEKIYNQGFLGENIDTEDWIKDQIELEKILKRRQWTEEEIKQTKEYYSNPENVQQDLQYII